MKVIIIPILIFAFFKGHAGLHEPSILPAKHYSFKDCEQLFNHSCNENMSQAYRKITTKPELLQIRFITRNASLIVIDKELILIIQSSGTYTKTGQRTVRGFSKDLEVLRIFQHKSYKLINTRPIFFILGDDGQVYLLKQDWTSSKFTILKTKYSQAEFLFRNSKEDICVGQSESITCFDPENYVSKESASNKKGTVETNHLKDVLFLGEGDTCLLDIDGINCYEHIDSSYRVRQKTFSIPNYNLNKPSRFIVSPIFDENFCILDQDEIYCLDDQKKLVKQKAPYIGKNVRFFDLKNSCFLDDEGYKCIEEDQETTHIKVQVYPNDQVTHFTEMQSCKVFGLNLCFNYIYDHDKYNLSYPTQRDRFFHLADLDHFIEEFNERNTNIPDYFIQSFKNLTQDYLVTSSEVKPVSFARYFLLKQTEGVISGSLLLESYQNSIGSIEKELNINSVAQVPDSLKTRRIAHALLLSYVEYFAEEVKIRLRREFIDLLDLFDALEKKPYKFETNEELIVRINRTLFELEKDYQISSPYIDIVSETLNWLSHHNKKQ